MRIRRSGGCRRTGGIFRNRCGGGLLRRNRGGGLLQRIRNRRMNRGGCPNNVNRVNHVNHTNNVNDTNRVNNNNNNVRPGCPGGVCPLRNNDNNNRPGNINGIINNINNSNDKVNLQETANISGNMTGKPIDSNFKSQNADFLQKIKSDPAKAEAFSKMSPAEQRRFVGLQDGYNGNDQNRIKQANDTNGALGKILGEGKMGAKDNAGNTLLDNLSVMKNQEFARGIDGNKAYAETVQDIANPDRIRQGARGTCTVTSVQHLNAKNHPSEYARVMRGLTSPDGNVQTRKGDYISRDEGTIPRDNSGRNVTSRIYQASAMEYGNGPSNYSNRTDWNTGGGKRSHKGLYASEVNRITNAIMPYDSTARSNKGSAAASDFAKALKAGYNFPTGINAHEYMVEGMDRSNVYLRNPHGGKNQHTSMNRNYFFRNVWDYQMPNISNN